MIHLPEWLEYASMPLIAAFVGWITKLAMIQMMFRPLEFKGIPPYLGWQGIIPRSAGRMANIAVDLMLQRILDPRDIINLIDEEKLLDAIAGPIDDLSERLTRDIMLELQPTIWEALPTRAQRALINRVKARTPEVMSRLLDEMHDNIHDVLDLRAIAVELLTTDKALMNRLVKSAGKDALNFIVRFGIPSGLVLGGLQAVVWATTKNVWVVPAFGGLIGLSTDYLALQMIFRPVEPRRYLGVIPWQGLFHRLRPKITRSYAEIVSSELLSPTTLFAALMEGPNSDKFFEIIDQEIHSFVDSGSGPARPLVVLALGGGKYLDIKKRASDAVLEQMRANPELVQRATATIELDSYLEERMGQMTNEEYEQLLRPAFKQDEWKIVVVGAVLGFLVGELQVHLLLT